MLLCNFNALCKSMLWRFFISMVTGSSVVDGSHMSPFGSNEHGTSGKKLICVCAFRNMSEPKKNLNAVAQWVVHVFMTHKEPLSPICNSACNTS